MPSSSRKLVTGITVVKLAQELSTPTQVPMGTKKNDTTGFHDPADMNMTFRSYS